MKRNDFLLLITLLFLTAATYFLCRPAQQTAAATVTVTIDGKPWGTYPLTKDQTIAITSPAGQNTLTIKNGLAKITKANCPHQLCCQENAIHKTGESIVCIPHKVVITAHSEHKPQLDAIAR